MTALATSPNSGIPAGLRKRAYDDVSGATGHAAAIMFVAPDGDVLLCRRSPSEGNYGGHWALPGGGAEDGETPEQCALREVAEELGRHGTSAGMRLLDRKVTPTGKAFHTFVKPTEEKFQPTLNSEHVGFAWFPLDALPDRLHPGVRATLDERLGLGAADMSPEDWKGLRDGFLKWTAEEKREGEHALDDGDPLEWGSDLDDLRVDSSHDGPWMSCMARDGSRMYRNRNVPGSTKIGGKSVDVDDMLKHHEGPEWVEITRLVAAFKAEHGREPDEKERVAIYHAAHEGVGTPGEREHAKAMGVDWAAWSAWCRGEEAKCERGPFSNEPEDADVRPTPHRHDLEVTTDSALILALDRESVRDFDQDGRLRVAATNISKANVCPYRGEEIPKWQELGLDPNKIYQLLRDPEELARAAPTFNGIQLLRIHTPVNAEDHRPNEVVGTTGTEAEFVYPYLRNSLVVWTKEGIDYIESEEKKELSSGYHYKADMTPGTFDGKHYDGVMRDIRGNHVALVEQGRAGPDVVVADSMESLMSKKPTRIAAVALRLTARAINPLLAMDGKTTVELMPLFADLTTKNFKERKPKILADLKAAMKGKTIAQDFDMEHVAKMLDHVEHAGQADKTADESVSEPQHKAMEAAAHGQSNLGIPKAVGEEFARADAGKDAVPAFLREKGMSEDDVEHVMGMWPKAATDEDPDEAKKKEEAEKKAAEDKRAADEKAAADKKAKDEEMKGMVTKDELDATLKTALADQEKKIRGAERDIRLALDEVRPYVGDLPTSLGFDSGAAVRRHALKMLEVDGAETVHESALSIILKGQRPAGARAGERDARPSGGMGMDAGALKSFNERFPGADRIKQA